MYEIQKIYLYRREYSEIISSFSVFSYSKYLENERESNRTENFFRFSKRPLFCVTNSFFFIFCVSRRVCLDKKELKCAFILNISNILAAIIICDVSNLPTWSSINKWSYKNIIYNFFCFEWSATQFSETF